MRLSVTFPALKICATLKSTQGKTIYAVDEMRGKLQHITGSGAPCNRRWFRRWAKRCDRRETLRINFGGTAKEPMVPNEETTEAMKAAHVVDKG